jgi:hypothetical protein
LNKTALAAIGAGVVVVLGSASAAVVRRRRHSREGRDRS